MADKDIPFNPDKPLRRIKHEKLAREIAKRPEEPQSEIYKEVYPLANDDAARANSSRLLADDNIRARIMALMSKSAGRPILEKVSDKVNEHMDGDNAPVSMDACKTVLRVAGALDEQKQADQSFHPTQINIIIRKAEHDA